MVKIGLLLFLFLLAGFFIFSDKNILVDSIKKRFLDLDLPKVSVPEKGLQDMSPAQAPDYSDKDRQRLDSILEDSQPAHPKNP